MKSKKIKVTVLWYAVLCSLVNIVHYLVSHPRRQLALETNVCTYAILSYGSHNSASHHICSSSCVQQGKAWRGKRKQRAIHQQQKDVLMM
jgi:hypothetical protein